jgi:hypothetical protein
MANNPNAADNLQPFKKGDVRINKGGRPKSFDAARKLAQAKMNEPALDANGQQIIRNGHIVTNAEMFFEAWMKSKDRKSFAEFAYGKVKEEIEVSIKSYDVELKDDDEE